MNVKKILLKIFYNLPLVVAGIALFTIVALEGMQDQPLCLQADVPVCR